MFKKLFRKFVLILPAFSIVVMLFLLKQLTDHQEDFKVQKYDKTPSPCENNSKSCSPCGGGPEGLCLKNSNDGGAWENSLSRDFTAQRWSNDEPDGTWKTYKKKQYYGLGVCGGYSYGEPFYARAVKY